MSKSQIVAREQGWFARVGAASIGAAVLLMAGVVLLQLSFGTGASFERLEEANANSSLLWIAGIVSCIGSLLMAPPLLFLFRAAQARSDRVKNQMVGLLVLGPVLFAISAPMIAGGTLQAADRYVSGDVAPKLTPAEAKEECAEEREDAGSAKDFADEFEPKAGGSAFAACEREKIEEDRASEAATDVTLLGTTAFVRFAGALSLIAAFLYTGLWSMRTGLLTRFWGSLGMVAGFGLLLGNVLFLVPVAWLLYAGFLMFGSVPGGRPVAWAEGEAVPWPTAGEKTAAQLEGEPEPIEASEPSGGDGGGGPDDGGERRKRKRRE